MGYESINVTYYPSSIIDGMLFDCLEDANHFDEVLNNYVNNPEALSEFTKPNLASWAAVEYHIDYGDYHLMIQGEHTEELIEACERMVAWENNYSEDCYTPVMNYIFNHILKLKNIKLCHEY